MKKYFHLWTSFSLFLKNIWKFGWNSTESCCSSMGKFKNYFQTLSDIRGQFKHGWGGCRQLTGRARLCKNKTSKLSLKLGTEKGRGVSHWDGPSVQTFLLHLFVLHALTDAELFVVSSQVEVRRLQRTTKTDASFVYRLSNISSAAQLKVYSPASPESFRTQTVKQISYCRNKDFGGGSGSGFWTVSHCWSGLWPPSRGFWDTECSDLEQDFVHQRVSSLCRFFETKI